MKWVVISLLLLNGIFLAIQLNKEGQTEQAVERFPFSGPKLVLLAEKESLDKAKQFAEKNKIDSLANSAAKPVNKAVTVAKVEKQAQPVSEPTPAAKQRPKPEPRIVSTPKPAAKPKPVPKPIAKSKSAAMACYSIGPFLLISDVKGVSQLFGRSAIVSRERSEALRKQVGYWLYIPPMASLQLARETLHRSMRVMSVMP